VIKPLMSTQDNSKEWITVQYVVTMSCNPEERITDQMDMKNLVEFGLRRCSHKFWKVTDTEPLTNQKDTKSSEFN